MRHFNVRYMEEMQEGGEPPAEAQQQASEPLLDAAEPELSHGEFFLMEGIKGTGEAPEWYKADKYKSIAEQARAYTELEKKLGSFTGAPKDGYQLPEGFDQEDALAQEVIKFGQETNLSQDGFNKLMELAAAQAGVTEQVSKEQELAKLGEKASQRIKQVEAFLKTKAGSQYEDIMPLVKDADSIMLVEAIMQAVQPPKLPIDGVEVEGKPTWEDIERELFKKDENGNLLMSIDRQHQAKVQRMQEEYGGGRTNRRVVG